LHNDDYRQLFTKVVRAFKIKKPTKIQAMAWPAIIKESNELMQLPSKLKPEGEQKNDRAVIIADQTGSGKTLGFLIPLIQRLAADAATPTTTTATTTTATMDGNIPSPKLLIIVPTSELSDQTGKICKLVANIAKFKSIAFSGSYANMRQNIDSRNSMKGRDVDVLVSTPGILSKMLKNVSAKKVSPPLERQSNKTNAPH